jgi:hypothetical protein
MCHKDSAKNVSAYYWGATPRGSCSRMWGTPATARSEVIAVHLCIDWLWDHHLKLHAPSAAEPRPTHAQVEACVAEFRAARDGARVVVPEVVAAPVPVLPALAAGRARGKGCGKARGRGRGR